MRTIYYHLQKSGEKKNHVVLFAIEKDNNGCVTLTAEKHKAQIIEFLDIPNWNILEDSVKLISLMRPDFEEMLQQEAPQQIGQYKRLIKETRK